MMNSKRLLTICGFAIGAAAISTAPAGAVVNYWWIAEI